MKRHVVWTLVLLFVVVGVPLVAGAEAIKHSGAVIAINKDAGTIVLSEVGPWRVEKGVTKITRRTISVTPSTKFVEVKRSMETPFPGDFVEGALVAGDLKVGDFVTVECLHEGKRLTAVKVTVTPPSRS